MPKYEIPLISDPQTLTIVLSKIPYNLTILWNDASNCWVLDIADINNTKILSGIPLVTGVNLLGQYRYLGFIDQLTVETDGDTTAIPTFENLGSASHLYFTVQ
jgi:hypothetical protein